MKKIQAVFNAILSKDVFEYFLVDKELTITDFSYGTGKYLDSVPKIGDSILAYLPELVGVENDVKEILYNPTYTYVLETIHKNEFYVNVSVEYYDDENILILLQNITEVTRSKQQILQYSNESLLLNNTLKKILDNQNALLFVTNNNEITFYNAKFTEYFGIKQLTGIQRKNLDIYKYYDSSLTSYEDLFERVNSKEEYIMINDDTFILQATCVESKHKLFTLSKVTDLKNKILIDSLTGAYKKTYFNRYSEKMIINKEEGILIVIDIDNFKQINDTYGHQIGDAVLKEFADLIMSNIRQKDIFARWGGEEFLLLIENINIDKALHNIERLRQLISEHPFDKIGKLTSSFGIAQKEPSDTVDSWLRRADEALYEAKNNGKNQIVFKKI